MSMTIEGEEFAGPFNHTVDFDRDFPCVYVILNPSSEVVDVGQTESVNGRLPNHDRKECWYQHGCTVSGLYVCELHDKQGRLILEHRIRNTYNPPCGSF